MVLAIGGRTDHFWHSRYRRCFRQYYFCYLQIFAAYCKSIHLEPTGSSKALNLGKVRVKKIALACLAIILGPLNIEADVIFFKDGMKTVCQDRAWEKGSEVKCEYQGSILTYQKNDVLRIEKTKIEEEFEEPSPKNRTPSKTALGRAKQSPKIKQLSPEKQAASKRQLQSHADNGGSLKTKGLEFYNPRRPNKYWTRTNEKHNTLKEAVAALAKEYDRSPQWIQHHMGIKRSLASSSITREDPISTGPVLLQNITPSRRQLPHWPKSMRVLRNGSSNIWEIRTILMKFIKIWQRIN